MQRGGQWSAGAREVRDTGEGDSLNMIPAWAVVLSVAIFVGSMYLFNYTPSRPANSQPASNATSSQAASGQTATAGQAAPAVAQSGQSAPAPATPRSAQQRRPARPAAEAGHLIFSYTTSAALAGYVLLIGYVSRDVKRRNMSAPLWMLIVLVFGVGGIGAIVYFLLRQPLMTRCPLCTTELTEGVHFCPQCRFQVAPVCGQCFRGVQITDAYCPQCGHDVAEDPAPARLRAYSDS